MKPVELSKRGMLASWVMVVVVLVIALATSHAQNDSSGRESGGDSSSSGAPSKGTSLGSFYAMSDSKFFKMKSTKGKIDLHHINYDLLAAAIFHATNQQRTKNGLSALRHLPKLDEAAMIHSKSMAKGKYLSHINPNSSKLRTPPDRLRSVGLKPNFVAENIATHFGIQYKPGTEVYVVVKNGKTEFRKTREGHAIPNETYASFAESLVDQWMGSPEHRKDILSRHAEYLGNACAFTGSEKSIPKLYCTQEFAAQ